MVCELFSILYCWSPWRYKTRSSSKNYKNSSQCKTQWEIQRCAELTQDNPLFEPVNNQIILENKSVIQRSVVTCYAKNHSISTYYHILSLRLNYAQIHKFFDLQSYQNQQSYQIH
ncbi:Hypothetical_protein [Hexamita inflata]|uniref:Hypothetical_protein n=1 Tax=Hexamita inflata TaxID=28002 RepID=A0AA86R5B7_9EUKA|nr:Hypothetical protein HINF_LOCUS11542 [Hexamita inflata]CAI9925522.1 Hypothetical protein HINF_LOCUS13167 [Hexamita inflata]CAI9931757.1 Hypothetical protein HINF_LOCUS19402 [Hexamita inflata]CAI9966242.1 Hypothetical protein HINF_LOCUS53887 [Hexamita inflata]